MTNLGLAPFFAKTWSKINTVIVYHYLSSANSGVINQGWPDFFGRGTDLTIIFYQGLPARTVKYN